MFYNPAGENLCRADNTGKDFGAAEAHCLSALTGSDKLLGFLPGSTRIFPDLQCFFFKETKHDEMFM